MLQGDITSWLSSLDLVNADAPRTTFAQVAASLQAEIDAIARDVASTFDRESPYSPVHRQRHRSPVLRRIQALVEALQSPETPPGRRVKAIGLLQTFLAREQSMNDEVEEMGEAAQIDEYHTGVDYSL